ncbi:TetR/AcrR family transcriptional regulator [uncultured Erythrobacter sp.]|uniref:TetR/AcrR family transcriptional regulator n=1 Tax=uncultured Erythrobacter sp. TaxID=263913 RepID=UPI0026095F12|nr:TetR/AcrR family transcriptional regulator [uncultured Erythrobacter sp.]
MNSPATLTKGERTRAHIVATAASLFWRRNFHGVSVDEVAQAAKVNKATVYRYFADKNDIALAVARFNGEMSLDLVFAGSFAEFSAPQDRLAAIYRQAHCAHAQTATENGDIYGCPIVGLALELGQEIPKIREEANRIFAQVEEMLTRIARDAYELRGTKADPASLGRTLTQLLHGAFASARLASDPQLILDAGNASLTLIGFPDTPILETELTQ